MKLDGVRGEGGSTFSTLLKPDDRVNELRVSPRLGDPFRLPQSDDVCCSLLDNRKPVDFQLSNDRRFACARRASHNVSLHKWFHFRSAKTPPALLSRIIHHH